jgi:small GTP-binding protein
MVTPREIVFKIVVVGEPAVGKTSLVIRFCENRFSEHYIMTIGSNFAVKLIPLPDRNVMARLQVWDLAGQTSFAFIRPGFYKGASGAIYVFDITKRETFEKVKEWHSESQQYLKNCPVIIVGNKADLQEERVIAKKEGEALANEIGAIGYWETSAKTGEKLEDAYMTLTTGMLDRNFPGQMK